MGLQDPFALRIARIQTFVRIPPLRVLEVTRPPDLEQLVQRVLARIADEPSDPHAHIYLAPEFTGYRDFYQAVVDAVADSVDAAGPELTELGADMPPPPKLAPEGRADAGDWARATCSYLSAVGDALPDEAGSLVLTIEPGATTSREALGWCIGAFAYWLDSDRAKVVVIDGGAAPLVPVSDEVAHRLDRVDFAVPPEEIEAGVLEELGSDDLDPAQAARLRLLAGSFATSAGRFEEAEAHLRQALEAPPADAGVAAGAPEPVEGSDERANVLYNLGNLYARTGRYEEAVESLAEAAESALDAENSALAAMSLTNLGLALYHEHRGAEALEALGAARGIFKALDHRPGEAHVVDCSAGIWLHSDPERARSLWREALAIYDSIRSPHLSEVRASGRTDIVGKLERLPADPDAD